MKLYHYSSTTFDSIDTSKCDGFWMTTIAPHETELLEEIGADGLEFVATVELNDDVEEIVNAGNYDIAEKLEAENAKLVRNEYDGFTDYAIDDAELVKILNWSKV